MKIQVDVDGVLVDFTRGFYDVARYYIPDLPQTNELTQTSWDYLDIPKDIQTTVWKTIKSRPYFFCDLKAVASRGEMNELKKLVKQENELYFVTARPGATTKWQTEQWIWERMEFMPTVIMTRDKAGFAKLIKPDWSIEDNEKNAYEIGQVIGPHRSCIVDRPYNRGLHPMSATRVQNLKEFLEKVNGTKTV